MTMWKRMVGMGMILGSLVVAQPLFALTLEEAKANGLVGERTNGYLGVVVAGNGEAQALVGEVNQKRRQAYEDIARRDGASIGTVETLAGEKAIQKTKPGYLIEGPRGWVKK
jgi:uncharacterized protein